MIHTPNASMLSPTMHTIRTDTRGRIFVDDVQTGRLSETPRRLLRAIMAHSAVATKEYLLTALYADQNDEPEAKILDVFVCKIRRELGEHGAAAIETIWRMGYAHGNNYQLSHAHDTTTFEIDADLLAETAFGAGTLPDQLVERLLREEHARQWGAPLPHHAASAVQRGARPAMSSAR